MKRRFNEYLNTPLSRFLTLVFLLISASAAAAQIFGNVQDISSADSDEARPDISDITFSSTFSEILDQSQFGGPCVYTGFSSPRGSEQFPAESRWRSQFSNEDIAFKYLCLEGDAVINLALENQQLLDPGLIAVSGTVQGVDAEVVKIRLYGVDEGSRTCWDQSIEFSVENDARSSSFRSEFRVSEAEGWSADCYLLRPVRVDLVNSSESIALDTDFSKRIDGKLRSQVPNDCYFVAALLTDGEIEGELGRLHNYINTNYMSTERNFGLSGPSSSGYEFDPALSIKLPLFPEWVYTCEPKGHLREFHLGGMDWPEDGVHLRVPERDELNIFYRSWSQTQLQVRFSIEFLDRDLESCGVWSFNLTTSNKGWDGWHVIDLPRKNMLGLDRNKCEVISLIEYEEKTP